MLSGVRSLGFCTAISDSNFKRQKENEMKVMQKVTLAALAIAPILILGQVSAGQAAAGGPAPAGATGLCKDGTYTTAASKSGACKGHKGVDKWLADAGTTAKTAKPVAGETAPKAAPAAPAAPAAAPAPAPAPHSDASAKKESATRQGPAPGGGPGMVWVNTSSNVYHCPGTRYYGTTKAGKYMSEVDAVKAGAHPDAGKACSAAK
jgi:Protein of unknown function (DUF3761)